MRNQNELKSKIEHPFTGSMAELQQELDEHHSQLEKNQRELHEVSCGLELHQVVHVHICDAVGGAQTQSPVS